MFAKNFLTDFILFAITVDFSSKYIKIHIGLGIIVYPF